MPKHVSRKIDHRRTELLDIDELFVQSGKGDDDYYFVWRYEHEVGACPFCGCDQLKIHDLFGREYVDVIRTGSSYKPVKIYYEFYKYRCLNPDCGRIITFPIEFASVNDNVTYRLEDTVADLVIRGYSYERIEELFDFYISRQAVGQIFNRWVQRKMEQRTINKYPTQLAVISGKTDLDQYTLFLNLDDGIRVFDVIYGVNSLDISSLLRANGLSSIDTLISDCDPIIFDVVNDNLPETTYVIPIDYWFKLVSLDFAECAHNILKWCTVKNKDNLIMKSEAELGFRIGDLNAIKEARPDIIQPHRDYNELRDIISPSGEPWTYNRIRAWTESVCPTFKKELSATILRLNTYREAIYQHELHPEKVPDNLFFLTEELENCLSGEYIPGLRTFSDACLKARLLFFVETDLEDWKGVPIEEVIYALKDITARDGGTANE